MVNRGITAVAVALALLASVHTAFCQTTQDCDRENGIMCYWATAQKYGVQVLIPAHGKESAYLTNVCASETSLPKKPKCETSYRGCNESEKAKFKPQEEGYQQLQEAVTNSIECAEVRELAKCIKKDVLLNCEVNFYKYPTHEGARRNHEAAVNLTLCLDESLSDCGQEVSGSTEYIQSIANALTLLYWHHEHITTPAPATSEIPSSTSVSTETPSHETTSPTTQTTVPTTKATTEPPHPTEHTTVEPVTTTTPPPHSTEPATTNPTETPTPATTPKPSGAATSVPFVGTLVFISAVWLAHAA